MQTNAPTLGRITVVFICYYVFLSVVLAVIIWAMQTYAGFTSDSSGLSALPLILAAMSAGQFYGTKAGCKPPQAFSWTVGLVFIIVSLLISIAVLFAVGAALGIDTTMTIAQLRAEMGDDAALIFGVIGAVLVLLCVVARFMFSMGAGQGAKAQAARAAKSGK